MDPVLCQSKPESSEYYCEKCHKSVAMPLEHFGALTGRVTRPSIEGAAR